MSFENWYIKDIEPYKLASHKVWDDVCNRDILKLDWNEATIPASPYVKKRILETIDKIEFRYYPNVNNMELLTAIAGYTQLNIENIQYFPSSDAAHEYIASVFLTSEDRVLILSPTYDNFRLTCQSRGADISYVNCFDGAFQFQSELFINVLKETKPIIAYMCNPNNPTGSIIRREYIKKILTLFPDILFVLDEAYIEFSSGSCGDFVKEYDNLIVSRTFSKAFALANFRIGYILASPKLIVSINKIRNSKNVTTLSQEAAVAALHDSQYMQAYVNEVIVARQYFIEEINRRFGDKLIAYESHGNFVLVKCSSEILKKTLIKGLEEQDIFIRDLSHKELNGLHIRITIGTRTQMRQVLNVIENIIGQ